MNNKKQTGNADALKDKLNRALRRLEGLKEKSKLLEMQYDDAKNREKNSTELVTELLERQRELNVMLNRANIMLNRTQEAMALTSMEFNEIAKALPEPKKAEWSERVAKINELFKKTGIQDAEVLGLEAPDAAKFSTDEIDRESQQAFGRKDSFWNASTRPQPPRVEAEPVDECENVVSEPVSVCESSQPDINPLDVITEEYRESAEAQKKSWWQKAFTKSGTED
ncbi:MAG: hypothetical protein ABFD49_11985 [Armatimonadota bacterium]|nr:hypothetical protein [bacterium]